MLEIFLNTILSRRSKSRLGFPHLHTVNALRIPPLYRNVHIAIFSSLMRCIGEEGPPSATGDSHRICARGQVKTHRISPLCKRDASSIKFFSTGTKAHIVH